MEVKNDVAAVRDILTKNANPDGSVGRGSGDRPDETGVEGVTNNEVAAASAALNKNTPAETGDEDAGANDGAGITEEELNALNAKLDAGEELTEEEQAKVEAAAAGGAQAGTEGEDVTLTTTELAEAIGWEAGDVYEGILVPLDDGQEPVTLGELKNQYQDQRRTITDLEAKVEQSGQDGQQNNELAKMSQGMMQLTSYLQQLNQIEQGTNWQELEEEDSSEAVLKRQKLWQAKQDTVGKMRQLHQREQQIAGQQGAAQRAKMIEMIPEWKDDKVRKADQEAIRTHLKTSFHMNDVEIMRIQDARTMAMLKDYVSVRNELNELKAAATGAAKRVRQAPRVMRDSGGRYMSQNADAEDTNISKLTNRAKRTGNKHDAHDAVKALLAKSQKGISRSVDGRGPRRRGR